MATRGLSNPARALAIGLADKVAPFRTLHRTVNRRRFFREYPHTRLFFGVFADPEAALRAVPAKVRIGHDHPEVAARHAAELGRAWPSDYPVLFWLAALLRKNFTVFDLGGNVGLMFHLCERYAVGCEKMRWIVCEVPAVAEYGARLAATRHAEGLSFTTAIEDACGADILLASGCLQFVRPPLWTSIARLRSKPRHLLLNRLPLCGGDSFVTLHNLGPAICLYQIWNSREFTSEFQRCGYRLIDSWMTPEFSCEIPLHAERGVEAYSGMYLRLEDERERPD